MCYRNPGQVVSIPMVEYQRLAWVVFPYWVEASEVGLDVQPLQISCQLWRVQPNFFLMFTVKFQKKNKLRTSMRNLNLEIWGHSQLVQTANGYAKGLRKSTLATEHWLQIGQKVGVRLRSSWSSWWESGMKKRIQESCEKDSSSVDWYPLLSYLRPSIGCSCLMGSILGLPLGCTLGWTLLTNATHPEPRQGPPEDSSGQWILPWVSETSGWRQHCSLLQIGGMLVQWLTATWTALRAAEVEMNSALD